MVGKKLSHYKITAELGRGGMGIVYKAEDTKLDRTVAIKVLPSAALASDDDRARFYREAKAAAQLHHPHIASVFEIDEAVPEGSKDDDLRPFIAMEFIEGETLHDRIQKGPLKLEEAVRIASEIASALEAAHEKSIVHRDIKSANVMLTSKGSAKVLDFGLAQTAASTKLTRMGSTLGTVAYMSPEQARGEPVDLRTDLWSLGAVLYEMIAGKSPFPGDYEQAVVYEILNQDPEPLTAVRTGVPMELERIVNKLLAKDANARYQSTTDLVVDLNSVERSGLGARVSGVSSKGISTAKLVLESPRTRNKRNLITGAIFVVILAAFSFILGRMTKSAAPGDTTVRTLSLEVPGVFRLMFPEASNDGRSLLFSAIDSLGDRGIYRYDMESGNSSRIAPDGGFMRYSPDGNQISFFREDRNYIMAASGGPATIVVDAPSDEGDWLDDGSFIFSLNDELWIRPASGGELRQATSLDSSRSETEHEGPFSIRGTDIVLFRVSRNADVRNEIEALNVRSGERTRLGEGSAPRYVNSGHLLYMDGANPYHGALLARPFDLATLSYSGPPVTLQEFAVSFLYTVDAGGNLFMLPADRLNASIPSTLVHIDDMWTSVDTLMTGGDLMVRLSPDGSRLAIVQSSGREMSILNLSNGVSEPVGISGVVADLAWSSTGDRIMISRDSGLEIWSASGEGFLEAITITPLVSFDWSSEANAVAFIPNIRGDGAIQLMNMSTVGILDVEAIGGSSPVFSQDGSMLAYSLDQGVRRSDIVVRRLVSMDQKYVISYDQLRPELTWAPDGNQLFAIDESGAVTVFPINTADSGPIQLAAAWKESRIERVQGMEISSDGSKYVVQRDSDSAEQQQSEKFTIIMNWTEQLKKLAPPSR